MKTINLVKSLSLSLLIATVVVAPGFAHENDLEDAVGVSQTRLQKKNIENLFEEQKTAPYRQDQDALFKSIIERSVILFQSIENEPEDDLFLGTAPQGVELGSLSISDEIFNKADLENFYKQAKKAKEDEYFRNETKRIVDESQERQRIATQPSTLNSLVDYAYSACKTTLSYGLSGLDYVVRSKPAAYYISYVGVGTIEETVAYAGYVMAGTSTTWYAGPQAGKGAADGAYYTIKAGFKVAQTLIPCFEGAVALFATDKVCSLVNLVLDKAPEVASSAVSAVSSAVSYIKSFWAQ